MSARPDLARVQRPEKLRLGGNARARGEVGGEHGLDDEVALLPNLAGRRPEIIVVVVVIIIIIVVVIVVIVVIVSEQGLPLGSILFQLNLSVFEV